MKQNKLNLFAAVALGGLMACAPLAQAQTSATTPPPPATSAAPAARTTRGPAAMLEKLNLTDDEKPKVTALLKEENTKIMALRQDTTVAKEDRGPKVKEIREATNTKMKALLTTEQYAKWEEMRKPRRGGRPGAASATTEGATAPATPKQ